MLEYKWTSVRDALPDETGWYLVFAPTYTGGSSSGLNNHDGIMFSQFKITKEGKKSWSIEVGYHERPGCVLYWMPLPIPLDFGHFEVEPSNWRVKHKIWVENGILGREATKDEAFSGQAEWCWECGNPSCILSKRDNLAMCQHFQKRSAEDIESDPHFGGH